MNAGKRERSRAVSHNITQVTGSSQAPQEQQQGNGLVTQLATLVPGPGSAQYPHHAQQAAPHCSQGRALEDPRPEAAPAAWAQASLDPGTLWGGHQVPGGMGHFGRGSPLLRAQDSAYSRPSIHPPRAAIDRGSQQPREMVPTWAQPPVSLGVSSPHLPT